MTPRMVDTCLPPYTGKDYKLLRHMLGISQRRVASRAGVSYETVRHWEAMGNAALGPIQRDKLFRAYGSLVLDKVSDLQQESILLDDLVQTDLLDIFFYFVPDLRKWIETDND